MWTQKLKIPGISANSQHPLRSLPFCRGHLLKQWGKIWWKSCRDRQKRRTDAVSYLKGFMKIIVQLEVMIKSAMNPTVEFLIRSLSLDFSLFPPRQCVCVCVCVVCVLCACAAQMNSWKEIWFVFSSLVIILIHPKCLLQSARAMWGTLLQ